MRYRKKPVEIEAIQVFVNNKEKVLSFLEGKFIYGYKNSMLIETLAGNMLVDLGDYIVKGLDDKFYLCKPNEFERTYELVK